MPERYGMKKNYSTSNLRNSASRLSEGERQNSHSRLRLDDRKNKNPSNSRKKNYEHLRHGREFNPTKAGTGLKNSRNKLEISDYYENNRMVANEEDDSGMNNTSQLSQESLKN